MLRPRGLLRKPNADIEQAEAAKDHPTRNPFPRLFPQA